MGGAGQTHAFGGERGTEVSIAAHNSAKKKNEERSPPAGAKG